MSATSAAGGMGAWRSSARVLMDFLELAKARLTAMVVMSAGAGFVLGSGSAIRADEMVLALLGIGLVAGGAAMLNQYRERRFDALMDRTLDRPLPAGRISPKSALVAGSVASLLGLVTLLLASNPLAAALTATSWFIYLFIYTPMKRWSTLNTFVGAIPGALPPVLGWAAAAGNVGPGAWLPFAMMFLWQMPHFFSIAWICRKDYARAGFWMLPVVDPLGPSTGACTLLCAVGLVPAGWVAMKMGMAGPAYATVTAMAGLILVGLSWRFAARKTEGAARFLFLYSLCYLPIVLLGLAAADRL